MAPDAELIAGALTTGYLQPRLRASGVEDWANWVVWYDLSELTLRPDRSENALQLYDRLEIDGDALRRSEEHTSELQSLMRTSYAVFCLKKKTRRHRDIK